MRRKTYGRFSTEFKLGVVEAYLAGEGSLKGLATNAGVDHSLVTYWLTKYHTGELSLDIQREEESVETAQHFAALKRKVGQLTMELDLPKTGLIAALAQVQRDIPGYGYRRTTRELRAGPLRASHQRVQRVMQAMRYPPAARRRPWVVAELDAISGAWYPILRAGLRPTGPNQLWVADITYVRLDRGFVLLAVVLGVFSPKVIGCAIGPTLDARLPLAALDAALDTRNPPQGCNHHSDRGSQYSSNRYREQLAEAGLLGAMSRAGNPYDHAHVESFMNTLKHEEIYPRGHSTPLHSNKRAIQIGVDTPWECAPVPRSMSDRIWR